MGPNTVVYYHKHIEKPSYLNRHKLGKKLIYIYCVYDTCI